MRPLLCRLEFSRLTTSIRSPGACLAVAARSFASSGGGDSDVIAALRRRLADAEESTRSALAAAKESTRRALAAASRSSKSLFVTRLDLLAVSASEASQSDFSQLWASYSKEVPFDELARGHPHVLSPAALESQWSLFVANERQRAEEALRLYTAKERGTRVAASSAQPPPPPPVDEVRDVQPAVSLVARHAANVALAGVSAGCLRQWCGKTAPDGISLDAMWPAQVWTHARDAAPSTFGALFIVEVKKPGDLEKAVAKAANYARRRVCTLFNEADARGEPVHNVFALAAGTDGRDIVFLRISSGAPQDGIYDDSMHPFPSLRTAAMPLLAFAGVDNRGFFGHDKRNVPAAPPAGFEALARILRAPIETLSSAHAAPLLALDAEVVIERGADLLPARESDEVASPLRIGFSFSKRLGCGGWSDVYAVAAAETVPTIELQEPVESPPPALISSSWVVKVPRCATAEVGQQFHAEASALRQLGALEAEGAAVPRLVGEGFRATRASSPSRNKCRWPLLLLSPACKPLDAYVDQERKGREAHAAAAVAEPMSMVPPDDSLVLRRRIADAAMRSVLRTLRLSHARGLVHCDVRPANLLVVTDGSLRILLADWGLCKRVGENTANCGVAAYAASHVFGRNGCLAQPQLDLAGAAYTWLSIAFGGEGCIAPWAKRHPEPAFVTVSRRDEWLQEHMADAGPVERLLALPSGDRYKSALDDKSIYEWPSGPSMHCN